MVQSKKTKKHSTDIYKKPIVRALSTAQESVPIYAVHDQYNLIESYPHCYTRTYSITDINYQTATDEDQLSLLLMWSELLNLLPADCEFQQTIFNRKINMEQFCEDALLKEVGDKLDYLRRELNQITLSRITEGKNGIKKDKYITLAVHAKNLDKAYEMFKRLDRDIDNCLKKMGSSATPVPLEQRLEILFDIYNYGAEGEFLVKSRVLNDDGETEEISSFDLENIRSMGLSVSDIITSSALHFNKDHIESGNKYKRIINIDDYASIMSDEFLYNLTNQDFNMVCTMNVKPIPPHKASTLVSRMLLLIRNEKSKLQRKARANGNSDADISPEILDRENEALKLRDDIREKDEHLFETTLSVCVFANSLTELQTYTETILTECRKASVKAAVLTDAQEEGFNSILPLGNNELNKRRTLKTSSLALFIPFSILELNDKDGINYSLNAVTKNILRYNRLLTQNFNGFVLGSPGSGKSFGTKFEQLCVLLGSDADIIVIDPESEYGSLAKLIGGVVVEIKPGGVNGINALALSSQYELEDETDPVLAKSDFVLKLCETIVKTPFGLNSIQETIIDECVHELFEPFYKDGKLQDIPIDKAPTLTKLQEKLADRDEPEARELSIALRLYTGKGSLNTFGGRTTFDVNNRYTVYDIKNIGEKLKPMAMLIILDSIWNKIVQNRKLGKNTWFYVDEIYLLFKNEISAEFLNTLFRRARKYGGVPTGLTQNVTPLLESPTARDMLQNCNFIQILNQAAPDREQLRTLLNLSDYQLNYITSAPKGQGLIYTGKNTVPFYSQFPKDNSIYRCITSDMKEIKEYEEQERRKAAKAKKETKMSASS